MTGGRAKSLRCRECGTLTNPDTAFTQTEVTEVRTNVRRWCDVKCYREWFKKQQQPWRR